MTQEVIGARGEVVACRSLGLLYEIAIRFDEELDSESFDDLAIIE